jgi:hypothetical protein
MGLNMNLIKNQNIKLNEINNLCDIITKNEINSKTLLEHQIFIRENYIKSFIQYYSLYGSSYINNYLRSNLSLNNKFINNMVDIFYNIINKSPSFDKDYILYRFIQDDKHLQNIKINDIYTDKSFISTSRNPFYCSKINQFGKILLKIKIPKNIEGIGLCVEQYSNFMDEEEIILNPCKMKLISKNNDFKYYHTNKYI